MKSAAPEITSSLLNDLKFEWKISVYLISANKVQFKVDELMDLPMCNDFVAIQFRKVPFGCVEDIKHPIMFF